MWHVGVHIWEVPPNEIEPNYDEYYAVCLASPRYDEITNSSRLSWRSTS